MATRLRAQSLPRPVRVEGARLRCAPPKRLTSEEASVETGQMSNCRFPISNWVRCAREPLLPKDLRISVRLRNVPFLSGTFRFVPFRSVLVRSCPGRSGCLRSRDPALRCCFKSMLCPLCSLCSRSSRLKTGNALCDKELRVLGPLRNVPELSVSFRNFPFLSAPFHGIRGGSGRLFEAGGDLRGGRIGSIFGNRRKWTMRPVGPAPEPGLGELNRGAKCRTLLR